MADKGLKSNVVGLFGGTMLGISSVAPAYALTATLGLLAAAVGAKTPVVIIAGFLPMFFAAYAYREFNRIMPDAGTSFTWTSKAFGPYIGWLGGWAAVVATIIVLSNLAGVAVQFLYQFIGSAANSEMISGLWENKLINVVTCLVFLAIATYVAYRGIDTTEHVQIVLVSFQLVMLVVFAVMAIAKSGASEVRRGVQLVLVQSGRSDPLGVHRRTIRFDLRLLGLGHRADGQRGVEEQRYDSRACGVALRAVDLVDLSAGLGRDPDVRRVRGHRIRPHQRGDLRQCLRQPGRTCPWQSARPWPLPCRPRLLGGQLDDHVPADIAHVARDGCLRGDAEGVRETAPNVIKTPSVATFTAGSAPRPSTPS